MMEKFEVKAGVEQNVGRHQLIRVSTNPDWTFWCRVRSHGGCNLITVLSHRNKDGQQLKASMVWLVRSARTRVSVSNQPTVPCWGAPSH